MPLPPVGSASPGPPAARRPVSWLRTLALTSLAMVAFAANSVLCRLALGRGAIDAASFAALRLLAGATVLVGLAWLASRHRARRHRAGSWPSALALFFYAVPFSFAYLSLATSTGALVLFAAVQVTMIAAGLSQGERPGALLWLGLALALGGLVVLALPGLAAPSPAGLALMATAGVAWGIYSLRGRGREDPLAATAGNFTRAAPLAALVALALVSQAHLSPRGAILAIASGAAASGLGYTIWYAALAGLTASRAATVQLSVPVLAALGGVLFVGERITLRLVVAAALILTGIALTLVPQRRGAGSSGTPAGETPP